MRVFLIVVGCISIFLTSWAQSATNIKLVDYYNAPAKPMNITPGYDIKKTVSARIPAAKGGVLTLKRDDGTEFKLVIPSGALFRDETIALVSMPKVRIMGQTQVLNVSGVEILPDGLWLKKSASLFIKPTTPIPLAKLAAFTSPRNGTDVTLANVFGSSYDPNTIELKLEHFSNYSVVGDLTLRESVFRSIANLTTARIQSWTAAQILKFKAGDISNINFLKESREEYFEKVIKPQLNNIDSCEGGQKTLADVTMLDRQMQLMGVDFGYLLNSNSMNILRSKTEFHCLKRIKIACYQEHRPIEVIQFAFNYLRQLELMGQPSSKIAEEMQDIGVKCMNFEFELKSTFQTSYPTATEEITAEAKFPFGYSGVFSEEKPTGKIKVTSMKRTDSHQNCASTFFNAGSVPLVIQNFGYEAPEKLVIEIPDMAPWSWMHMRCFVPGDPPSIYEFDLPQPEAAEKGSVWRGKFTDLHFLNTPNEFDKKKNAWVIKNWDMLFTDTFAVKKYQRTKGNIKENTIFTIYHRPKP